jgi:hypothetical protein
MSELPSSMLSAVILALFAVVALLCGLESAAVAVLVTLGFAIAVAIGTRVAGRRIR